MNYNTIPTSPTHQWNMDNIQIPYNYQQTEFEQEINTPYENFSQIMTTNSLTTQYSNLSPDNSSSGNNIDHPKTSASASKPVRRRSRASKKTPTTLVNASISNFRAVVQQYTGCHTCPMINNQKGPINLSFGAQADENSSIVREDSHQYGYYYNSQEMNSTTTTPSSYTISGTNMFGLEDYGCQ